MEGVLNDAQFLFRQSERQRIEEHFTRLAGDFPTIRFHSVRKEGEQLSFPMLLELERSGSQRGNQAM